MRSIRHIVAVTVFLFCTLAQQDTSAQGTMGTVLSDLWWNPNESGWGVTVDQQERVMFLTFFIQRADGSPYWVTATLDRTTPGEGIVFPVSFSGNVYETHGTYYGLAFNPAQTVNRLVGTATFQASSVTAATLTYSIDGVAVQRPLVRQTLVFVSFEGSYAGGYSYVTFNCTPSSLNGEIVSDVGTLNVVHSGTNISMSIQGQQRTCSLAGTYAQTGQMGITTNASLTCSDGTNGTVEVRFMQKTYTGVTAAIAGRINNNGLTCDIGGPIGGITSG